MTSLDLPRSKVTTAQQAKLAYVYVRQSSLSQVTHHSESTELQYHLVERAVTLGWPCDRVKIIDDDLGKSGTSSEQRPGFQQRLAEISLARVGLVLSLDASRLARNNSDWHRLLELCALFGTLLADGEQLYDPRQYHDRLLLGLSGMMSEAELHQLKIRLQAGARQKAARGELSQPLPAGLERQRDGHVILTPDDAVQIRIRLIFDKFEELGSAHAVMRYLQRQDLSVPTRPLQGPAPHAIVWQPASASRVLALLHNPAYAGAYVHGRTTTEPGRQRPGRLASGVVHQPLEHWPVCLQGSIPPTSAGPSTSAIRHGCAITKAAIAPTVRGSRGKAKPCCRGSSTVAAVGRGCDYATPVRRDSTPSIRVATRTRSIICPSVRKSVPCCWMLPLSSSCWLRWNRINWRWRSLP